jgi:hypothetical protein
MDLFESRRSEVNQHNSHVGTAMDKLTKVLLAAIVLGFWMNAARIGNQAERNNMAT